MATDSPDETPARTLPSLTAVIDWATLTDGTPGRLDGTYTGLLTRTTIERLLCDCTISRVITGPDSVPIDVGRETRVVNRAQRRAATIRDGGCRFPGCHRAPPWCDLHHVTHWDTGGNTDLHGGWKKTLRPPRRRSRGRPGRLGRHERPRQHERNEG